MIRQEPLPQCITSLWITLISFEVLSRFVSTHWCWLIGAFEHHGLGKGLEAFTTAVPKESLAAYLLN